MPIVDTLTFAKSLLQAGLPKSPAEAIALAAGEAISGRLPSRSRLIETFTDAGLPAIGAEALADLFRKVGTPKPGTLVDTLASAHRLKAAGMAVPQINLLLDFLAPSGSWDSRSIFSTDHTAREFEGAGLTRPEAEALAGFVYSARRGKAPDTLTIARTLETLGMVPARAAAVARCFLLAAGSPTGADCDPLIAVGMPQRAALILLTGLYRPRFARRMIDTLAIVRSLRAAGMTPSAGTAIADVRLHMEATLDGAVAGTHTLAAKLVAAGIPDPQAEALVSLLCPVRPRPRPCRFSIWLTARTLRKAGMPTAQARAVAAALYCSASTVKS